MLAACGLAALVPAAAIAEPARPDGAAERTASASSATTTTVTVDIKEPAYDGLQTLLDDEARQAMADGKYRRAWYLFWRLLEIDPDDTRALREAGRVAQALGAFNYSVDAFKRVEVLTDGKVDPELHYLRGEALDALGRHADAEQEWQQAEREIALAPLDRQRTMWLARIAALRHDLGKAISLYQSIMPVDRSSAEYAEVDLAAVEAYCLSKQWPAAERELRAFLRYQPQHPRAEALLAWVLEGRGRDGAALPLRAQFADEWTDHPRKTVEYARALERVYDLPDALDRYREARDLGVPDLDRDIARVSGRVAPELGGGMQFRSDGGGSVSGWSAGANVPLGRRNRLAVTAVQETSAGGGTRGDDTTTSGSIWAVLADRKGDHLGVAGTGRTSASRGAGMGVSAMLNTTQDSRFQVQLRGDWGQAWRESANTVREGGVVDDAQAVAYAGADQGRLLFSAGVQGRRLTLAPDALGGDTQAVQVLGIGGVDYQLVRDPTSVARGEILGSEFLAPRVLSSAIVLSYRHYELSGDNPFPDRLTLVTRSSLDELSASVGQVIDPHGMIAAELHGGVGHDWIRDGQRYRAGASLMISLTHWSRFTFDYDIASETYTGLVGRFQAGEAVLHVDL
ncbi:MAG TPA: tetratricopeptide repeat protein [Kofleriaceae bacterium]|nr:tetratricopeptide repeat protein [Kofleriaceae bacterium]